MQDKRKTAAASLRAESVIQQNSHCLVSEPSPEDHFNMGISKWLALSMRSWPFVRRVHPAPKSLSPRPRASRRRSESSGGARQRRAFRTKTAPWHRIPYYFKTDWDIFAEEGHIPPRGDDATFVDVFRQGSRRPQDARREPLSLRDRVGPRRAEARGVQRGCHSRLRADGAQAEAAGIEPIVTLWHFTFPAWLYELTRRTVPISSTRTSRRRGAATSKWWARLRPMCGSLFPRMSQTGTSTSHTLADIGRPACC